MALKITNECISCGACESACPNNAIYRGEYEWAIADGTSVRGNYQLLNGAVTDAEAIHQPLSNDIFYIVPDKCTECMGFHDQPQCAFVCPVDCCVTDEQYIETMDELLARKDRLHP